MSHLASQDRRGRYGRFFVGVTPGFYTAEVPTVEGIADNLEAIRDVSEYRLLRNANEETGLLMEVLSKQGAL